MKNLQNTLRWITISILSTVLITFIACDKQAPFSPDSDADNVSQTISTSAQALVEKGPLTQDQLNAITAPQEKIQIAEDELNILKSKSGISLQKRFVRSWYVALGDYGWAFVGDEIHGRCYLYFPPYAMSQASVVKIDWESTGFLEGGAEFSPHGTQFNSPLTLWISYKDADLTGVDEENLKIWYFNDQLNVWELIGDVVDTENKMVGGLLDHFSRYAIGTEN